MFNLYIEFPIQLTAFFFLKISIATAQIREGTIADNSNNPIANLPKSSKPSDGALYMAIKLYAIKGKSIIAGRYLINLFLPEIRFKI